MSVHNLLSDNNTVNSSIDQTGTMNNELSDLITNKMARYDIKDATSPAGNSESADWVGKASTTNVEIVEDFKNFLNMYKIPDNFSNLVVPGFNMENFELINHELKQKDIVFMSYIRALSGLCVLLWY